MKYKVTLGNKVYEVEVEKGNAVLLDEYEAKAPAVAAPVVSAPVAAELVAQTAAPAPQAGGKTINSPLPGTVVAIKKNIGDVVKKNEVVAIIEAMKMENDVTANEEGTVTAVLSAKGASVQQGTPLISLK